MTRTRKRHLAICIFAFLVWPVAVTACLSACGTVEHRWTGPSSGPMPRAFRDSGTWVVDGLHVTGSPIKVDIASYRLNVSGDVEQPLWLTYDEVRAMPSVREQMALVCPGVFVDEGEWTGVRLRDILHRAGVKSDSALVTFISMDERYRVEFPLAQVMRDGFLIAYEFEGREFDERNGFPLRLAVKDEPGYYWVKWLGRIEVVQE